MLLTESNLRNEDGMLLELTYTWPGMAQDRVQVWYNEYLDMYHVKFDGYADTKFHHFGSVLSWLGDLVNIPEWC